MEDKITLKKNPELLNKVLEEDEKRERKEKRYNVSICSNQNIQKRKTN